MSEENIIQCPACGNHIDKNAPDRVSVWGMYDCHLFEKFEAGSVEGIVAAWIEHNRTPNPAKFESGREAVDLGPVDLCPIRVMSGNDQVRSVGKMVHVRPGGEYNKEDLQAWIRAAKSDPDIPRLLAATAGK